MKKTILLFVCLLITHFCDARKTKVAFWINYLAMRGVEVSVFDYADCNEKILGNESIILNNMENFNNPYYFYHFKMDYHDSVRQKFAERFGDRFFNCADMKEAEEIMKRENVDIFYAQKYGNRDDRCTQVCKNAFHAVFVVEKHGDAYASISSYLSEKHKECQVPFVPYMVKVDSTEETLRKELGIPEKAVVFGRHGGIHTFSIPYAKEAVIEMAKEHPDWFFLFLNTDKFCDLRNVLFLPGTADMANKTKFINTCDVMIHARLEGETFGLACGEFSLKNKPIITCLCGDLCHVEILGSKGFYYRNKQELKDHMKSCAEDIDAIRLADWDCYSAKYSPEAVMKKFDEIFIQPLIR